MLWSYACSCNGILALELQLCVVRDHGQQATRIDGIFCCWSLPVVRAPPHYMLSVITCFAVTAQTYGAVAPCVMIGRVCLNQLR